VVQVETRFADPFQTQRAVFPDDSIQTQLQAEQIVLREPGVEDAWYEKLVVSQVFVEVGVTKPKE